MALIPTKKISQLTAYNQALQGNELFELDVVNLSRSVSARAFVLPSDALITHQNMVGALPGSRMLVGGTGIVLTDIAGTIRVDASGAVAGPANPTAQVGLVAVNGAAVTYMRSDAAPALSQAIAPTWSGAHIWTNTATFQRVGDSITASSTLPETVWNETDAAANNRSWAIRADTEQFLLGVRTDAGVFASYMVVDRTAQVVDSVNFTSALLQINGTSVRDATNLFTAGTVPAARLPSSFSGLANPTASVGLAAVNGVATTAMRSDGAPALSQAIVPTWTAQHIFGLSGATDAAVLVSSVQPQVDWNETDGAANNRRWRIEVNAEQQLFRMVNDANSAAVTWMAIDRTLNVCDSIALTSTALTWNGNALLSTSTAFANPTGTIGLAAVNGAATTAMRSDGAPALSQAIAPTWTAAHVFTQVATGTSVAITMSSATPIIAWNETDGAANNRRWDVAVDGEQMLFRVVNDAVNAAVNWLVVDRTLNVVDRIAFPATAVNSFIVGSTTTILAGALMQVLAPAASNAILAKNISNGAGTIAAWNSDTTGNNLFVEFGTEAAYTARGSISYNRGGGLVAYNTTSDARLKKNIQDAPDQSGFVIDRIKVRQFDWRDSDTHLDYWFVAQELFDEYPIAVSKGDERRHWGVDNSILVPLLIKEVQSLRARMAQLDSPIRSSHEA